MNKGLFPVLTEAAFVQLFNLNTCNKKLAAGRKKTLNMSVYRLMTVII